MKILYSEFISHLDKTEQVSQGLMFPDTIEIEPSLHSSFEEIMPDLLHAGFQIEYEEENRWKITAVPSIAKNIDPVDIIKRLLDAVNDNGANYGKDSIGTNYLINKLALIMARSSAVNYGQKLSEEEMEELVVKLFSLADPLYSPNGNKIFYVFNDSNLNSVFK